MAEAKTQPTSETLASYLTRIDDPQRRVDCEKVAEMMAKIAKKPAVVWGTSIVGFGTYPVLYAGGKTADWPALAFASRANDITLYLSKTVMADEALMLALGKAKQKGGCLHIKRLADIDLKSLTTLMKRAFAEKVSS